MSKAKGIIAIMLALVIACGGLIGCAAPPVVEEEEVVVIPPPAKLKPCTVELDGVYLSSGGGLPAFGSGSNDMVVKTAEFVISNPNDYQVSIDGFSFKIDAGEGMDIAEQIASKYWIPAGEKITLEGACCFSWFKLFQEKIGKGHTFGPDSIGATCPMWKALGGPMVSVLYYGIAMKADSEVWAAAEPSSIVYNWEVRLHTAGEGMDEYSHTSGSLSE